MSIEKNNKNTLQHEESGFTILINETVDNIKHTGALGVYAYLAAKPAGWNICKNQLKKHFSVGRDHIDKCFQYLKSIGLIEIISSRNSLGRIDGWTTILKRKIPAAIQNTENQCSGENTGSSRSLEIHIVDKSQCGKPASINKLHLENKEIVKKTKAVPVFSCSKDVQTHLESILLTKNVTLSPDDISQIMFYVGAQLHYPEVMKLINIALKKMREKKWNIPQGWKGVTSQAISAKEENYFKQKEIQQIEDGKIMRDIVRHISPVASSALTGMLNNLRGGAQT